MGIFLRGRVELFTGGTVSCCWIPERDDAGWSQNCMPSLHLPERKGCALYRRVSELLLSPKEGWRREWEEWLHEGRRSIYITFDEKRYGKTYKDSYIRCLISKKKKKRKEKRKSKKERKKERKKAVWILLTVCSCHGTYVFQSESTLHICLNFKELLARSRREIWSFIECNWTRSQNHLVRKWTLNHWPNWPVRVQLQSGFESSCSHLNYEFSCFLFHDSRSNTVHKICLFM